MEWRHAPILRGLRRLLDEVAAQLAQNLDQHLNGNLFRWLCRRCRIKVDEVTERHGLDQLSRTQLRHLADRAVGRRRPTRRTACK
ncbi:hypothetical protein CHLRE_09g413425v5 [Chlamydomonas reinhardtii]|uniref:Uncharacterized protein n=1 Tax=Chlamydomonas reinhardtii TaxID=3055 RepID=A0A2K3DFU3_CHLRE|nr:uncharacterized protein CHLRE_09g413425v5 [Chlamydomonas reinhardtii]PNW79398.1 hypothetical protein CHLRE_09g413425v5 [Chlamydomonas reinhardtii]